MAGLTDIPTVRELSDRQRVAVGLIENIQREELTAAEEARALKRLAEDFSLTHQELADSVGRSRAAVTNLIRLLDLPDAVVMLILLEHGTCPGVAGVGERGGAGAGGEGGGWGGAVGAGHGKAGAQGADGVVSSCAEETVRSRGQCGAADEKRPCAAASEGFGRGGRIVV